MILQQYPRRHPAGGHAPQAGSVVDVAPSATWCQTVRTCPLASGDLSAQLPPRNFYPVHVRQRRVAREASKIHPAWQYL